ncbi:snare associated Golgi protein-domain-containing protein [Phlebopus sp. FC_14]|nr:snare associated Golgi protein-domain-containing protein [Phlebopus sp. FC_14]
MNTPYTSYDTGPYRSYSTPAQYNPHERGISRTPSPTPSEAAALKQQSMFNFRAMFPRDKIFTKKYILYYLIGIVVIVIGCLFIFYHDQIVYAVQPAANWMHSLPFGWLIPIGIFFVISFPPLFGHEILAIVCGLVWGVWIGFGITAAGTFLGEVGNFYAFKYLLGKRAEKEERKNIQYACIAKLVREGGFKIALIVRYSAVPGHFTTAIFAVCGMNIWVFMLAAILSMPKHLITVYIGTLLESTANGGASNQNKILSYVVGGVTAVVTVAAMWYIQREVNRVKPDVIYARRKARQVKLEGESDLYQMGGVTGSNEDAVFNPNSSEVTVTTPLAHSDAPYDPPYQQWDNEGRAVGYADPGVLAPQPRRANGAFDPGMVTPTRATSAAAISRLRQESTDSVGWELQTNAADGQSYPLHSISDSLPAQPLRNPYEDKGSSEPIIPPFAPPPGPPPAASPGYAFSSPQHSFAGGNAVNPSTRLKSPPPPTYRS